MALLSHRSLKRTPIHVRSMDEILLLLIGLTCLVLCAGASTARKIPVEPQEDTNHFVIREGHRFTIAGKPFFVHGWNTYPLLDCTHLDNATYPNGFRTFPAHCQAVDEVLQKGKDLGMNVMRTWAFHDGPPKDGKYPLQLKPGKYDEHTFQLREFQGKLRLQIEFHRLPMQMLDYILHRASEYGIRLILPFVNFDSAYGGALQYLTWSKERGGTVIFTDPVADREQFYTDPHCKEYYKNHVKAILERKNTFNKRRYRDDPTIFAFELGNQPRAPFHRHGNELQAWIEGMSSFIRDEDPNHLICIGSEGWFGASTPGLQTLNPPTTSKYPVDWNATEGSDFVLNNILPAVDFATLRVWDHWLPESSTEAEKLQFWRDWIVGHISASEKFLDKPVLLEEFGVRHASQETRNKFFKLAFDLMAASFKERGAGAGTCFWMLSDDACPDYDGFAVYYPAHESTGALIEAHAENIRSLQRREERLRFIMSLVTDQLPRFGSKTHRFEMTTSGPVTKRPTGDDALSAIAGDSQAARDFRKALARHHPEVNLPEHVRPMRRPDSWEEDLEIMPGMMRAAIEIRLLLALSFLFCVLALFFIYQAAFPSKKIRAVAPQE